MSEPVELLARSAGATSRRDAQMQRLTSVAVIVALGIWAIGVALGGRWVLEMLRFSSAPAPSVLEQAAGALQGKILLDATNPIGPGFKLALGHNTSGGEMIAAWAKGAHVYKVFNTTGYNIMANPLVDGRKAMMLVAGDNDEHKGRVLQLVREVGFEAFDFGKLENARLLEPLALVWIRLAYQHGLGRDFAFGILRS